MIRVGIDLGGTKIEGIALDSDGEELARHRVATPADDYRGTLIAIKKLVGYELLMSIKIFTTLKTKFSKKDIIIYLLNKKKY